MIKLLKSKCTKLCICVMYNQHLAHVICTCESYVHNFACANYKISYIWKL